MGQYLKLLNEETARRENMELYITGLRGLEDEGLYEHVVSSIDYVLTTELTESEQAILLQYINEGLWDRTKQFYSDVKPHVKALGDKEMGLEPFKQFGRDIAPHAKEFIKKDWGEFKNKYKSLSNRFLGTNFAEPGDAHYVDPTATPSTTVPPTTPPTTPPTPAVPSAPATPAPSASKPAPGSGRRPRVPISDDHLEEVLDGFKHKRGIMSHDSIDTDPTNKSRSKRVIVAKAVHQYMKTPKPSDRAKLLDRIKSMGLITDAHIRQIRNHGTVKKQIQAMKARS